MDLRPYLQFNRNISSRITRLLVRTPVTPNLITLTGLGFGIAAGWNMAGGTRWDLLAGAALLHLAFILDNCDGELARLTGRASRFGKRLDMTCDLLVDFALWTGLGFGAWAQNGHHAWALAGLAAAAGSVINFCMVIYERRNGHSTSGHMRGQMADDVRNSTSHSILETLCHNGDVIALVWILSALGSPALFLIMGSVYIHLLWIFRSSRYFPRQSQWSLQAVFGAAGIYLLYLCTRDISWVQLGVYARNAGWGMIFAFLVFPFVTVFHTLGLYYLLPAASRARLSFRRVYRISLFGEAVNKITPFVDIGGEPIKVRMLAQTGAVQALQSARAVWASRVLFIVSEAVYLIPALALLILIYPSHHFAWIGGLAILFSSIYAAIVYALQRKAVGPVGDGANLPLAFVWHLAGWFAFSLEAYLILRLMGIPVDALQAFLIQAFLQVITTVSFFIPANIGAQEGGLAFFLRHLGFTSEGGVALSLLKRVRQFFWAAVGFAVFAVSKKILRSVQNA